MLWQREDDNTDWIRVLTPHAGKDDRGILFVPVKNDEVIVGFHYGNPDLPFVAGSVVNQSHSKISPQRQSIKTAAGSELVFFKDEEKEYVSLSDKDGNQVLIDTTIGTVSINSKGNIKLSAKDQIMLKCKNLNIEATDEVNLSATNVFINTGDVEINALGRYSVDAASIIEMAEYDFTCISNNGDIQHITQKDLIYKSEEESISIEAEEAVTLKGKVSHST